MIDLLNPAWLTQQTSLLGVWLLGVSLGLTACTATCLPFMATWVLGRGGTPRQVWRDTSWFVFGRIIAYALLGAFAAGAGNWLAQAIRGGTGNFVIGAASIAAGIWLLLSSKTHASCRAARNADGTPPMMLGFSLSLTPCAPLASLLAVCAAEGSIKLGMAHGMVFGLGAALTPMLILLPLISLLGSNLRENREWITRWIRWGAAAVLVALGLRRIFLGV